MRVSIMSIRTILRYVNLAVIFCICETMGNFEQKRFDILADSKLADFTQAFADISVIECASKCMSYAREDSCMLAGYDLSSRDCQISSNNVTLSNTGSNFVVLRISENCGATLETDYSHVIATYPSGTLDGASATVTCAPGHRSESGLSSWTFLCDTAQNGWTTLQAPDCIWELMFRGTAENAYDVADAFLFGKAGDGVTSEEGCMDVYNDSCLLNYRNSKMDQWISLNIDENNSNLFNTNTVVVSQSTLLKSGYTVTYELYNSTSSVLEVKFDGSGSTINSWFSTSTVLSHPWNIPSLADTWWDLNGPTDSMIGRSFRMTAGYDVGAVSCADHFYTVVFFPPVWSCSYDDFPTYPQFTYSTSPNGSIYDTNIFQTARAMGIWVKYH